MKLHPKGWFPRSAPPAPPAADVILPKDPAPPLYTKTKTDALCKLVQERDAALARAEKAEAELAETHTAIESGITSFWPGTVAAGVNYFVRRANSLEIERDGLRTALRGIQDGIRGVLNGAR